MDEINIKLIKENVKKLCEKNDIDQTTFAGIIDTSQSYLSKLLNPNSKNCFNLNHLFKIVQKFNVSIDELAGLRNDDLHFTDNSTRQICKMLTQLIEVDYLTIREEVLEEDTAYVEADDGTYYSTRKPHRYFTLYFSNYRKLNTHFRSDEDYEEEQYNLKYYGNDHEINQKINNFLSTYTELCRLYQAGNLTAKAFHDATTAIISNID